MTKSIVLCGFMGSGKTVTGTLLAQKLNLPFVDMDQYIEQKSGMTVSEIFATKGEAAFRKMETEAATELGKMGGQVIACGGGAVLRPENVTALKQNGVLFYLQVSPKTVLHRLERDTTRPLLATENKAERIFHLLGEREPLYRTAADYTVDANGSKEEVANTILNLFSNPKE